ncbi:MAG: N-6 DNA methylase [Armatimonadota bacterium]|nr:N-6 DNA methylase [Armatimonadota bacterium]
MNGDTKRKIDNARNVLVGKVPDPKSQVEQITLALIYRFMDYMDDQSEGWGGKARFFTNGYEKYAWSNLVDRSVGGHERLELYGEALTRMSQNPHLPQLFRDIFKNAFLPYRAPETLRLFLSEIDGFPLDHTEDLGDSYEYLLSIMGKQGEAGQFRTPRHIIDFIVKCVDPQKDETILDPACGTAGFLICAYQHIMEHDAEDGRPGGALSTDEKNALVGHFAGYDIDPGMVRLALVNMYFHGFQSPSIHEYDTLSSEDRWDESYDVIMANPPFMTPMGGIRPHKRFSVHANRSEVLFVDYIAEHLNPAGRAGIIVPEGIIFTASNAYKSLRKMLVENYLYAVVSLPAGVFNPYAGVKTSILLMDRELAKRTDEILFVKVENDGLDLGAQRREIDKNDLPAALEIVRNYQQTVLGCHSARATTVIPSAVEESAFPGMKLTHTVSKSKIAASGDYNLSGDRYRETISNLRLKWPMVELGQLATIIAGQSPPGSSYNQDGNGLPFYQGKTEFGDMYLGAPRFWTTVVTKEAQDGDVLMSVRAPVGPVNIAACRICIGRGLAAIRPSGQLDNRYTYYLLRAIEDRIRGNGGAVFDSISRRDIEAITIPLPPLDVQQQIVAEIDAWQKVIDGAKQVIAAWKPTIPIDPDWPIATFEAAPFQIIDGDRGTNYPSKSDFVPAGHCLFLNTKNVRSDGFRFDELEFIGVEKDHALRKGKLERGDVLLTTRGTIGNTALYDASVEFENIRINSGMLIFRPDAAKLTGCYLFHFFQSENFRSQTEAIVSGAAQPQLPIRSLNEARIPLPPLEVQRQIVTEIEEERKAIEANKKLIEAMQARIKAKIAEVWGE